MVFLAKCAVWAGMIAAGVALAQTQFWWAKAFGVLLVAMAFAHGIELEHQALHSTGTGSRALDRALGFTLGVPLLISFHHYQDRHLHHHQHVGTDDDSEFFQFSKEDNERPWRLAANLLMLPHWARVAQLVWAAWTGGSIGRVYNKNNERRIRRDYAAFGVIVLAAVALFAVFRPFDAVLLLAFPMAACMHTLLELPEHWGCARSPSVLENTRTVRAGFLATWFTNGNNFHVEHHLAPALRPEAFRAFHERIAPRIVFQNSSYFDLIQDIYNSRKASYA
ncbi:fatty acid desaturase [Ramlibacter sp.]|uniref:fatty acid desaturase family protein n=1 Tax=Ramlibacter sp. TaxID=1917967 RepID=UPI0017E74614|nr:fatty acid desaturase [Ramlibacter sp.]MBA2673727.1 fatty acid desaturase [Ramlibacter sp.]